MRLVLPVIVLLATVAVAAQEPVPVYEEPRHRLVFDDHAMRILDLSLPAGETTLFHTHDQPILYILLNDARLRSRQPGGDWVADERPLTPRGFVFTDISYAAQPVTHQVDNVGDADLHLILVLNERLRPYAPGIDVAAKLPGALETDNRYFAQSRIVLGPAESLDWSGVHSRLVLALVSDTHVTVRNLNEAGVVQGMTDAGDFVTVDGDSGLHLENRSGDNATIIAVAVL